MSPAASLIKAFYSLSICIAIYIAAMRLGYFIFSRSTTIVIQRGSEGGGGNLVSTASILLLLKMATCGEAVKKETRPATLAM